MFALIIGIDAYLHAPKLKGAVADADRLQSFLITQVGAKTDRIITLRNENATREAIVRAFHNLWECLSIQHEDPVLIFYAGHGCEMPRPKGWETGGNEMIQAICPCDMTRGVPSKQAIYPIPDLTIAIWLNVLSSKKGNNIVSTQNKPVPGPKLLSFRRSFLTAVIPQAEHGFQRKGYVIWSSLTGSLVP